MSETVAVRPEQKHTLQLSPERFKSAEFERNVWVVDADEAVIQSDVLKGDFWGHVAEKLKPWDHIFVRADNGTWYTELLVLHVARAYASVHPLNEWKWGEEAAAEALQAVAINAPYFTKWGGPHYKWTVIRRADMQRVAEKMGSERDALEWIVEREKAG
jgi:hypothetical protein